MISSNGDIPRVLVTMGEPAGIGPELLVKSAASSFEAELVYLACPKLLKQLSRKIGVDRTIEFVDWKKAPQKHKPGVMLVEAIALPETVETGQLNIANATATLGMLNQASSIALSGLVDAIVTAPVHKANLNTADPKFLGHTEFFADACGVEQVVMMLASGSLRVTLATTHLPLADVSAAITSKSLTATLEIIIKALTGFGICDPRIAVCGLNPHAGENGLLGQEDDQIILPVVDSFQANGHQVFGPLPADTVFTPNKRSEYDVVLAMYHDQGLPVVKAFGFGQCANVTLGLPYVRTSVDHGTALDIASSMSASAESLDYATRYAIDLVLGKLPE